MPCQWEYIEYGKIYLWKDWDQHMVHDFWIWPVAQVNEDLNIIIILFSYIVCFHIGDIAFRYLKYLKSLPNANAPSHVTISDINQHMLDVGKIRAEKQGFLQNDEHTGTTVDWVCANAEELPFDNDTFTAYTIAFGIRNVTHIDKVLSEAYRVLKPGGRFMCLEFSHLTNETLQW